MSQYVLTRNQLSLLNQQGYVDIVRDGKPIRVTYPQVKYGTFRERDDAEKTENIPFKKIKKEVKEPVPKTPEKTHETKTSWLDSPCYYVAGKTPLGEVVFLLGPFKNETTSRKYAYYPMSVGTKRKSDIPHFRLLSAIKRELSPSIHLVSFASVKLPDGKKTGILNDSVRGYKTDSQR